jgi:poly(rC)-binding protein 2/3/4
MAETPQETPTATSKRPFEEPSSPSGPTDQPDAKRPALDKVLKEEGATDALETALSDDAVKAEESVDAKSAPAADSTDVKTEDGAASRDAGAADASANGTATSSATAAHGLPAAVSSNGRGESRNQGSKSYVQQDESSWLHVRAIISSAEAATVIGKGGENVSQIRALAGAKLTVSEYSRGAVERILTVSGPVDAVAKAFGLIIRTLNQEPLDTPSTEKSKTYPLRLLIPHILIGSIIGKSGVRIREIQEQSGARLNASETTLPLSTERSLVVLGVADAVHIATYYIGSTLVEQLTERFGGPSASNYASRHGGPQSVVPGGMQIVPYVPQQVGGQMGHADNYRRGGPPGGPNQPPRQPAPYGQPYPHGGQQPHQQPQAQPHYNAGSPRAPYVGPGGPPQQAPYGQHPGVQQPHHAGGAPQQPPMAGMPGQPITQQIFIPNDMVGAIIGKGGQKINEIRQLSGSVIKINEPQDNNNERLVMITGTAESNQMALYMLYQRLGESSKNSNSTMPR